VAPFAQNQQEALCNCIGVAKMIMGEPTTEKMDELHKDSAEEMTVTIYESTQVYQS
jgi:hypothetical protein